MPSYIYGIYAFHLGKRKTNHVRNKETALKEKHGMMAVDLCTLRTHTPIPFTPVGKILKFPLCITSISTLFFPFKNITRKKHRHRE